MTAKERATICQVIETLRPGGAERLLATTLRHADRKRFRWVVVCLSGPLDLREAIEREGAAVHCLAMRHPLDVWRGLFGLARLLRRERVDVVHTHLHNANLYGRLAARLAGVPHVVTTLHNPDYTHEDNGRLTFALRKRLDRWTGWWINERMLAVSDAVRQDYERHLGLRGTEVLHNYTDLEALPGLPDRAGARNALGIRPDAFLIVHVGRLHRQKGQRTLLDAMARIRRDVPHAQLVLVGDGPDRAALTRSVEERGLGACVHLVGQVADVAPYLAAADLFVFPSRYEAFGIAMLEAMAMGLPVIASRVDGVVEVVTHGVDGWLIGANDPTGLAEAVVRLTADAPLRRRLGEAARRTVRERFAAPAGVARLTAVYEAILGLLPAAPEEAQDLAAIELIA